MPFGILRRRCVEQAVELVAEDVETLGKTPGRDVVAHGVPKVERMIFPLCQLLGRKLAAAGDDAILRRPMDVNGRPS
jgi:hypothetical protein